MHLCTDLLKLNLAVIALSYSSTSPLIFGFAAAHILAIAIRDEVLDLIRGTLLGGEES